MDNSMLTTYSNLTYLLHYEKELRKSIKIFQTLFDLLPFSCLIESMDETCLMANKYFCEISQKPLDQIIGRTMEELGRIMDPDDKKKFFTEIRQNHSSHGEMTVFRHGKKMHFIYSASLIDWKNEKAILLTTVDITDKKETEMALKENEENLQVTLNSIGEAVIATDVNGKVTRMNPIAEHLTGWPMNEAIGRSLPEVFHILNAKTMERVESPVQTVLSAGKTVPLSKHSLLVNRNGQQYKITESASPIRNLSNDFIGMVLVFRDMTEEYDMQGRLRQAQKLEAIGVLAGGIAHDFNNILSAIMGFTDLAILEAGKRQPIRKYLGSISSAALRARDLVRHILTFSRKNDVKKEPIFLEPIVRETLKFIRASLPANIEIRQNLRVSNAQVMGDTIQFHQVLMNLFTNAGHSMKECGGILEVTLDTFTVRNADQSMAEDLPPGRYYQLTVSDTGSGIPKTITNRIFEPFFTTKKREEGTGMGLSTVYGILKEMGGGISVSSEESRGSVFNVIIPAIELTAPRETFLSPPLITGNARILIVDDEELIVDSTQEILSQAGHAVTGVTSSNEALEIIRKAPQAFDLIITDMSMPFMNGLELSKKILAINPEMPILLCTGFSEGLTRKTCTEAGIKDLIMKPMIAGELSMTVHKTLTEQSNVKSYNDSCFDR